MKGIVFTEFLQFLAANHGEDFVDDLLHGAGVTGAYTAVGTYDFQELAKIVGLYCQTTGTPLPAALKTFGEHLAQTFQTKFREFYASQDCVLDFLARVDSEIHVEVRKLYPGADLPEFKVIERSGGRMVVDYASCRPLADLAVGLIEGSSKFYGQQVKIARSTVEDEYGHRQRFEIAVA